MKYTPFRTSWLALATIALTLASGIDACATQAHRPGTIQSFHVDSVMPAFGGKVPPGASGPYVVIRATITGTLDPDAPGNAGIVDLKHAPRDRRGQVRYRTDALILRPKRAADATRVLVYDVVNRGGLLGKNTFIGGGRLLGGAPPKTGMPSWLARGYTVVWSGWQADISLSGNNRTLGTDFPEAAIHGRPVTGMSREEYIPDNAGGPPHTFRLSYPPANPASRQDVTFTARETWLDAAGRETDAAPSASVPHWRYTTLDGHPAVTFTSPKQIPGPDRKPMKPDAGTIYSFVYRATGSKVDGIGLAAVRDLMHFLRHNAHDASGHPNPLADMRSAHCATRHCAQHPDDYADAAIAVGISQSGRFLRDFLYQGFNDAGDGQSVFDGLMPIIAGARRIWLNTRFAQPGRWSKQHEDHFMRGFQFPFAYNVQTDPISGRRDGLLRRCQTSHTCPKIMQVDGSFEWWNGAASLVVTDGAGKDLRLPAHVRYYLIPGTGHGGGPGVRAGTQPEHKASACRFVDSPVSEAPYERALFARLADWVTHGTPPPPSRYPTAAAHTAVPAGDVAFPALTVGSADDNRATVHFRGRHNQVFVTRYKHAVPEVMAARRYTILEPQVDRTGNELGGIPTPAVRVPLATYTGWNLRAPGHAEGELCGMHGAMFPLTRTGGGDARPSLAKLYQGPADYQRKVDAATRALRRQGYLLQADADAIEAWARKVPAAVFGTRGAPSSAR